MSELPLFPLNTVLFPEMPLPLQIFEDRYKEMIGMCLAKSRPFGVVLIKEGRAEHGPLATPHEVGCTAVIAQSQTLDKEGRLLVLVRGQHRFRIRALRHDRSYLVGEVVAQPLLLEEETSLKDAADRLRPRLLEYLTILAGRGKVDFNSDNLPHDTTHLAYMAATVLQTNLDRKQTLLETNRVSQLLSRLNSMYHQEVGILRLMPDGDEGPFSAN